MKAHFVNDPTPNPSPFSKNENGEGRKGANLALMVLVKEARNALGGVGLFLVMIGIVKLLGG